MSDGSRQVIHNFRKFAGIDLLPQDLKHTAAHGQRIYWKLWWQLVKNAIGEFFGASAVICRITAGVPESRRGGSKSEGEPE